MKDYLIYSVIEGSNFPTQYFVSIRIINKMILIFNNLEIVLILNFKDLWYVWII